MSIFFPLLYVEKFPITLAFPQGLRVQALKARATKESQLDSLGAKTFAQQRHRFVVDTLIILIFSVMALY